MKVSIITISFNQAEYLIRNRESIVGQKAHVEHILVDPGSTDGSRNLIADWAADDSHVVAVFDPDRGPADGLNHGLERVSGEVWLYLNADDELAPGAVQKIIDFHENNRDTGVLIAGGWTIDANGHPIERVRSDRFSPSRYAMNVGTVLQQGTSFKTSATLPWARFNIQNRLNWDTELLFDLHRSNVTFGYSDDVLGYFRLQPSSITMSGQYEEALHRERQRLRQSVTAHQLLRLISPIARATKALRGRTRPPETFPGLVGQS